MAIPIDFTANLADVRKALDDIEAEARGKRINVPVGAGGGGGFLAAGSGGGFTPTISGVFGSGFCKPRAEPPIRSRLRLRATAFSMEVGSTRALMPPSVQSGVNGRRQPLWSIACPLAIA